MLLVRPQGPLQLPSRYYQFPSNRRRLPLNQGSPLTTTVFFTFTRTAPQGSPSGLAVHRQPPVIGHQLPAVNGHCFCTLSTKVYVKNRMYLLDK